MKHYILTENGEAIVTTYGGSFNVSKELGENNKDDIITTKRGALLLIVGTVWDFHPKNVVEYIVRRVKP